MQVILVKPVRKLGKVGETVVVANGYGRNYLIPQNLAIRATNDNLENLPDNMKAPFHDIKLYMSIVGNLIWISTIRFDILLPTLYLSWAMQKPMVHHYEVAIYLLEYLQDSKSLPLVLGGEDITPVGYTDAALGAGNKGKSIIGHIIKMGKYAGAVDAGTTSTQSVHLSSYTSELDGATNAAKKLVETKNIFNAMHLDHILPTMMVLFSDNEAMISFVKGVASGKQSKCMELRLFYLREQFNNLSMELVYMPGKEIPTDHLTKLGNQDEHYKFVYDIMGLSLLDADDIVLRDIDMMKREIVPLN